MNVIVLTGNLTADAETKKISDRSLTIFRLGFDAGYGDSRQSGFIDVEVWGKQAETCARLVKGARVCVKGQFRPDNWTSKEGQPKSKFKIHIGSGTDDGVDFLSANALRKPDGTVGPQGAADAAAQPAAAAAAPATAGGKPAAAGGDNKEPPF